MSQLAAAVHNAEQRRKTSLRSDNDMQQSLAANRRTSSTPSVMSMSPDSNVVGFVPLLPNPENLALPDLSKARNLIAKGAVQSILRCGSEKANIERDNGIRRRCGLVSFVSMLGLGLAIMVLADETDLEHRIEPYAAITSLTILSWLLVIEMYVFERRLLNMDCDSLQLPRPSYWKDNASSLLSELVIHGFHPLPTMGWEDVSLYFMALMFMRAYTVFRIIAYYHPGFPMRFEIFGRQQDKFPTVSIKWGTFVKVIFLEQSIACFFVSFVYALVSSAFVVFIAERDSERKEHFSMYTHCLWFCFVTASTIGYGDMVPWTTLGKITAVGVGVIGIVLANMIAAILAGRFAPSAAQSEIMNTMLRLEYENTKKHEAANVLR